MWEVQFAAGGRQNAQTFPLIDAGGRRPKANILGRCGGAEPPHKTEAAKTKPVFQFFESQFFESQFFESQFFEGQFFGKPVL